MFICMIAIGDTLLGKYRVERILGEGGMGLVAQVRHLQLDEPMAIKFLLPDIAGRPEFVHRFLREAQAAAKLKNEHICRVFDVGVTEDGTPYMIMEYLEGADLQSFLRERGPQSVHESVGILLQACEALVEAHARGIVHRDIKPANFFMTMRADGTPLIKLLDFGISKQQSAAAKVDLTSTQATLGTPAYMSPEQLRSSKQVDARTDIWALGVVMYELLCGARPFTADTFSALCMQIGLEHPPPLADSLPAGIAEIVMRCLEKEPGRRYASVTELAAALRPYGPYDPYDGVAATSGRFASLPGGVAMTLPIAPPRPVPGVDTARTSSTTANGFGEMAMSGQQLVPGRRRWWPASVSLCALIGAAALFAAADDAPVADVAGSGDVSGDVGDPASAVSGSTTRPTATGDEGDALREERQPEVVRIVVNSRPEGAEVLDNGAPVGVTPHTVELATGAERTLDLARDGYRRATITLPDAAGADGAVTVELQPSEVVRKPERAPAASRSRKAAARQRATDRRRTRRRASARKGGDKSDRGRPAKREKPVEMDAVLGWE